MADDVDRLIKDLKAVQFGYRRSAAEALGDTGDTRAVEPLVEALKDEHFGVRRRAAKALGMIGDARAVGPLIGALRDEESDVREASARALDDIGLEKIQKQLTLTREKHASILCASCFSRFIEHKAQLGPGKTFLYYACRECQGSRFVDNVTRVVAVLDPSMTEPYVYDETTFLANWYSRKSPFDFDEVRIKEANDFDIDELVMRLKNDMDDKRRKRYKTITVHVSPQVQLSQAQMHMLRDTFGRVETTE